MLVFVVAVVVSDKSVRALDSEPSLCPRDETFLMLILLVSMLAFLSF